MIIITTLSLEYVNNKCRVIIFKSEVFTRIVKLLGGISIFTSVEFKKTLIEYIVNRYKAYTVVCII